MVKREIILVAIIGIVSGITGSFIVFKSQDLRIKAYAEKQPGHIILDPGTGNVGIGTSSPMYKLDVVGNTRLTGTIRIEGGSPGLGKVLTSDAVGNATWKTPSGLITIVDTTLTTAVPHVDITGLNINEHGRVYEIFVSTHNPVQTTVYYSLFVENDFTATNYWNHYDMGAYAGKENNPNFLVLAPNHSGSASIILWRDALGYPRYKSDEVRHLEDQVSLVSRGGVRITAVANITTIRIAAVLEGGTGNGIGAGSRILIRRVK